MRVYLDVDGVLSDFVSACQKLFDKPVTGKAPTWHFYRDWGVTGKEFWDRIDAAECFYDMIDKYPWADRVVALCEAISDQPVTFLTMPESHGKLKRVEGRRRWLANFYPGRRAIVGEEKSQYAAPDAVLIDDCKEHIDAFREAGGNALWFNDHASELPIHDQIWVLTEYLSNLKCTEEQNAAE